MPCLPIWFHGPFSDVMQGHPAGTPLGDTAVSTTFFQAPPNLTGAYFPLGLAVVPHEHGLVIRVVRGWAAANTSLVGANVILSANNVTPPDYAGMLTALMDANGCTVTLVDGWPTRWILSPESRNARI